MTREQLEQYRSNREEMTELKQKLRNLDKDESIIESDVIMDYSSGFPVPQKIVGINEKRLYKIQEMYRRRIEKLEASCEEVEDYVESIEDSITRRIFRMKYMDGESQEKIGMLVHLEQSSISKKISRYLKCHTIHKNP